VSGFIDHRQVGILSDRYLDIIIGDIKTTLLLLIQAPLIAVAVAGVWSNVSNDSLSLYFVLCLSAFFLGAVNACREIVKERALFLREKMFNLSVGAYLMSKYRVQAILVIVQCVILAGVVRAFVPLKTNILGVGLVLLAVALTGTAVGLLVSSWVKSADKAVGVVPLIVIPQILFSDFVLGENKLSNWTARAQEIMPVHWGYEMLRSMRQTDVDWGVVASGAGVLTLTLGVCFSLSLMLLFRARY
jgi:ABC transport system ATP-binding/permease protein